MTRLYAYRSFAAMLFFFGCSSLCYGNDGKPASRLHFHCVKAILLAADTVPAVQHIPESGTDSTSHVIKEVPKARKQVAPVAISVKPIKVIKPKIIKPVIKIK